MGKLLERLAEWDDRSVIYRADDPEQKVHWDRLVLAKVAGSLIVFGLLGCLGAIFGKPAVFFVIFLAFLVGFPSYMVWRRNRNRRLTGSPTKWPSSSPGASDRGGR